MRTKRDILQESSKAVVEAPKEAQQMIAHEYLMLEVFIDIRDILDKNMQGPKTPLEHIINKI